MTEKIIRGEATMVDLGNVTPLLLPWTSDPFGYLRPPLSVEALRLSAEMARSTYTMSVDRWVQAGWRDITIQVDGSLTNGVDADAGWLQAQWRLHKVRSRIRQRNPIGQVMGAIRQKDKSDTGKVLVMLHPAPGGRYVVAISFMGTGERFYDWFSNFRMTSEDGVHKGFLQLTEQFEDNENDILFPDTARELGLERLTLRHILQEAKSPGSRFVLWLSGHSQGGALMQVYALHKLRDDGVLPSNLLGYGFASPSVVSGQAVSDPGAYPLYHIFNSDDVVPHMGAQVHLGLCLTYPTGDALRSKCYGRPRDDSQRQAEELLLPLMQQMCDTPACLTMTAALLLVLSDRTLEELLDVLSVLDIRLPVKPLLTAADARVDQLSRSLSRRVEAAHLSITGRIMDRRQVAMMADELTRLIGLLGLKRFAETLMQLMRRPHGIQGSQQHVGPYIYIALDGVGHLEPFVWVSGQPPRKRTMARDLPRAKDAHGPLMVVRRRQAAVRRKYPAPKRPMPRPTRDTRHHVPTLSPSGIRPGERLIHPD
ncbi:MAG: hypothetical protein ACI4MJ_04080 [Aristaeellaceae bacterium]